MPSQVDERSTSNFSCAVKRKEAKLVVPSVPPPVKDGIYWLSNLDIAVPMMLDIVFFFESKEENNTADPVMVLQSALAQILIHYYPLAGRIELTSDGRFQVISSGEGAVFVEAEADANISDVLAEKNLERNITFGQKLLYSSVRESKSILDQPLLAIQVTKFKCGGFCVGTSINHCMCDGVAFSEFLISLGEIARGVPISIQPALDRTLLKARDPLQIEFSFSEKTIIYQSNSPTAHEIAKDALQVELSPFKITETDGSNWPTATDPSIDDMVSSILYFDSKTIDLLKKQVLAEGVLKTCSSFDVMCAFIWRIRIKALGMASSQLTKLVFAVDSRSRFCPPLPKGYHGNAIIMAACSVSSAGELIDRQLSYAVGLVQEAKEMINDKYLRSRIDYMEQTRPSLCLKSTLILSSWCGIPFHKADYGWGEATHYVPVGQPTFGTGLVLPSGEDRKGMKIFTTLPSFAWANIKSLLHQLQENGNT